jgi:glycosyltransferase involved in cell wall biosynthesis
VNGIRLLLDAFQLISDPNYRLWIFGRGPMEEMVRTAATQDKRIVYWGFLPNSEVVKIQRQATLLLNARPTDQLITRYTFPSKLLEYMLSGRPTLSTALPGIPEAYHDFIYVLREENPEALASMIQHICSRPLAELDDFGQRARAFMLTTTTWKQQGKRVCEFLGKL